MTFITISVIVAFIAEKVLIGLKLNIKKCIMLAIVGTNKGVGSSPSLLLIQSFC